MTRWWMVLPAAVAATALMGCGAVYLPAGPPPSAGRVASSPASASASISAAGSGSASGTPVRTGTVPPTGGSATGTVPQPAPQTVTLANDGQTITMKVGQTFTLELGGPPPDWTVHVTDPSILARLPNFAMVRGAQGIYQADQVGTATLTATSTYPCQQAHPACMIASRAFWLTVVVQPR